MPAYLVTLQRTYEVTAQGRTASIVKLLVDDMLRQQFPLGGVKILSIVDVAEPDMPTPWPPKPRTPMKKPPKPFNGGSPGATVVRVPALVDQTTRVA